MPGRARQKLARELVILHLLDRDQSRILAVRAGGEEALVADKQAAVAARRGQAVDLCVESRIRVRWLPLWPLLSGRRRLRRWRSREVRLREHLPDDLRLSG